MSAKVLAVDNQTPFLVSLKAIAESIDPSAIFETAQTTSEGAEKFSSSYNGIIVATSAIDDGWKWFFNTIGHRPVLLITDPTRRLPFVLFRGLNLTGILDHSAEAPTAQAAIEQLFSAIKRYEDPIDAGDNLRGLSDVYAEVLPLLLAGHSNREISERLQRKETTVRLAIRHILKQAGVLNRAQLATMAIRAGLIS